MIVNQLLLYFILIIFNDLSEVSINTSLTLSFAAVLELFLQTFDRFFLSRFISMSYFTSYIFLQLMFLVLIEGFCLNAQEGYRFHYCFTLFSLHFCFQRVMFQKLAQNYIFQFSFCLILF